MTARLPSLNALRAFDAAARLGSFKAAAEALSVTPTAVSHQIKALEEQLGVALFMRHTRRIELTEAGGRLADATGNAFAGLESAIADIGTAERLITLTATPAFAALWLAPRVAAFELSAPEITVRIDATNAVVDLDRERQVDLALRYSAKAPSDMTVHASLTERFMAFAAPSIYGDPDSLARTALLESVWQRGSPIANAWGDWFAAAETAPTGWEKRVSRFADEHHAVQAGLSGQGIVLASSLLVADLVARGWLVPFRPDVSLPGLSYHLVSRRAPIVNRHVERFLRWLTYEMAECARQETAFR